MRAVAVAGFALLAAAGVPGARSAPAASLAANGRIVFASARPLLAQPAGDEIYSLDLATGGIRDLSRNGADDTAPALAPNGTRIAFARSSRSDESALWLMRSDGSGQRRLAELAVLGYGRIQEIAWSPDGTKIAFSAAAPSGTARLWIVGADGSGLRQLTDFFAHAPSWSPDGAEIAFSAGGDPTSARVGVIRPDGTGLRWLTGPGDFSDTQPAWSPDGKWVAFVRTTGAVCEPSCGSANLFVIRADGSDERQVTAYLPGIDPPILLDSPGLVAERPPACVLPRRSGRPPRAHPRRRHRTADAGQAQLCPCVVGAERRPPGLRPASRKPRTGARAVAAHRPAAPRPRTVPLESPSSPVLAGPYWSRGGKALVFASVSMDTDFELLSAGPRGGGLRRLTHERVDEFDPAWSPDGRTIAFGAGTKLETVRPNGTEERTLFDGGDNGVPAQIGRPSWSPDGQSLAVDVLYDHGRWTEEREVIVSRDGKEEGSLVCYPPSPPLDVEYYRAGNRLAWSPDGRWLAVDGLAVCRVDGSGGYWLRPGDDPDWRPRRN
jgi:Tol biopolymer transport system component